MGKKENLEGKKFGKLIVLTEGEKSRSGKLQWKCQCACGNVKEIRPDSLKSKRTISCGCYMKTRATRHGKEGTRTYHIWEGMKQRVCNDNPESFSYKYYIEKGIALEDPRWLKFENFLLDMGEAPEGKTLDRIDNNKGYCKENCRWATRTDQQNNRSNSIKIKIENKLHTVAEAMQILQRSRTTVLRKYHKGDFYDIRL